MRTVYPTLLPSWLLVEWPPCTEGLTDDFTVSLYAPMPWNVHPSLALFTPIMVNMAAGSRMSEALMPTNAEREYKGEVAASSSGSEL